jgi:hypothetical protein
MAYARVDGPSDADLQSLAVSPLDDAEVELGTVATPSRLGDDETGMDFPPGQSVTPPNALAVLSWTDLTVASKRNNKVLLKGVSGR